MSSNYHERIMNAQIAKPNISDQVSWSERERLAYKFGHRDARHAAAEIANEADRQLEAAGEMAKVLAEVLELEEPSAGSRPRIEKMKSALAAWTAAKEGR